MTPLQTPTLNGPADHVAFVIHGIGQQTEQFGFFQKHLQSLYDTTNHAVQENRPDKEINIAYIPIEWHKQIHKETDTVMDDITLRSIPTMRMVNNDYLADAFFYLSKERGQSIVNHVTNTFNEAYLHFISQNRGFTGKISILAYSLGGIITWDILSNQLQKTKIHSKLDLVFPPLLFKPDFFFTLGSPLSAFLTVRDQDPKLYHPHPSIVFENIFHPYDPLAYRFEPLLKSSYKNTPAVLIDTSCISPYAGINPSNVWQSLLSMVWGQHQKISLLLKENQPILHFESTLRSGNTLLSALKRYLSTTVSSVPLVMPPTPTLSLVDDNDSSSSSSNSSEDEEEEYLLSKEHCVYIPTMDTTHKRRHSEDTTKVISKRQRRVLETTVTKGSLSESSDCTGIPKRIDFVLQPEKTFFGLISNPYLCGLTAHFSYWTNQDLMWHIVRRLENM
ncbi:DDHD domain-containing protein [Mucor mucedo]|uniref:DDHD domain-containing protein n=1 Tax=Mucor mucedo TaxID=29922 RepID=UPI00221FD5CD|nr:DDHD domain-containing protein [Mucor mucedo]KAI7890377.1 DDHD domain-containing protein [Mucor mucedo]